MKNTYIILMLVWLGMGIFDIYQGNLDASASSFGAMVSSIGCIVLQRRLDNINMYGNENSVPMLSTHR